jgi:zinc transport system ATP-binding protein
MSGSSAIEVSHVSFYFRNEAAVQDVSFSIEEGDFLGIIGPNGGGKTTLLRLILGVLRPHTGVIRLLGDAPERSRRSAGYVPQETSTNKEFPILVRDAVRMGLAALRGMGRRLTPADKAAADAMIEEVGLGSLRNLTIGELSGGQRQKVLLARALVAKPKILFLDEPTASIDTTGTDEIYQHLERLNNAGTTVVLVTHNISLVSKYIKSVACINKELYFHAEGELDEATITKTFGCPVDFVAHGVPHRVFHTHEERRGGDRRHG